MASENRPPQRGAATPASRAEFEAWWLGPANQQALGSTPRFYADIASEAAWQAWLVQQRKVDRLLGWGSRAALCLEGYEKALRGLGPGYRGAADYVLDLRSEWEAADNRHLDAHPEDEAALNARESPGNV